MGAFFDSIHVRTDDVGAVQKVLEQVSMRCDAKFLLGPPLNGWISILPGGSGPDESLSMEIAKDLTCAVFHLAVHDDDVFYYFFYREGKLVDQFDSCPDYFEAASDEELEKNKGRPELFQDLLADPSDLKKLKRLLSADKFTFESERISKFAELFNLSNASTRYNYVRGGARKHFSHVEYQPQSADDYNKRGEAKLAKNDLDGALADFKKALELDPDLAAASENCLRVEAARNDQKIRIAQAHKRFAQKYREMGRLDDALALLDKAIEYNPGYAVAYNNRGLVKKDKGNRDEALADFNKAIELNPKLSAAYVNRGDIKRSDGEFDEALADYNKAIELKPDLGGAYNHRGELKRKKADIDGAIADYTRAIELEPNTALFYSNRSIARRMKRELDTAMADCDKAIELKPDLAVAYNNRAMIKRDKGDIEGALNDLERAVSLKPKIEIFRTNRDKLIQIKKGQTNG